MSAFPQRHRFAEFAAVAERNAKDNAAQKGHSEGYGDTRLPQRHRFAEFAAVAERNAKDNAAQKGYSEGFGDTRLPQRHRFAEFAAVAEGLSIFADEYGTERRDSNDTGKCDGQLSGIHRAGPLAENADDRIHRRLPGLRASAGILP